MDCDEIIDQLLEEPGSPVTEAAGVPVFARAGESPAQAQLCKANKRERLAALAAGGQAKQYLGKALTADQVDSMDDEEVERLYARYEARLGAAMTKSLRQAVLQAYSWVASRFLSIPPQNQPKLVADLEADPFVGHALSSATCELYHRYGMYLAPLTVALTTAKYRHIEGTQPHTMPHEEVVASQQEHVGRDTNTFGLQGEDVACGSRTRRDAGESDREC